LENAYELQGLERGARLSFPKGVEAEKREEGICFYKAFEEVLEDKKPMQSFSLNGFDGGRYAVSVSLNPIQEENGWRVLKVDGEKIPKTALYRYRQEGDFIQRFGGGKKTLKKFFNEEKTPVGERAYLPLIAEENGEVYVVCGVEISEKVKVTANTKSPLYITIRKK
jgi:tRNA(Ile)-lysidine synthase